MARRPKRNYRAYCSFQEKRPSLNASVYSTAERYNGNVTRLCSKIDLHNSHTFHRTFHTHAHTLVPHLPLQVKYTQFQRSE